MPKLRKFCLFLLVNALTGFASVAGITSKQGCPGESIAAFQGIIFDKCHANISLYQNNGKDTLIATWSMQNCKISSNVLTLNVSLDENGTIWIHNLHPWDESKYVVTSDISPFIYEVEIIVMAPPNENCKPIISKLGDSLFANLPNVNDCGKPVATLYWEDSAGGIFNTSDQVLRIPPGSDAGKYYACIQGPALLCVRNLKPRYFCSIYVTGSRPSSSPSGITDMKSVFFFTVGIPVCIIFFQRFR